jgi:hypothetical protein
MLIKWLRHQPSHTFAQLTLVAGIALILSAVFAIGSPAAFDSTTPFQMQTADRCTTCHSGIEPISTVPQMASLGCATCHGGNRLATTEGEAHTNMVRNPGSLEVADKYCGTCHAAQIIQVRRAVMSTYTGAIGFVRRTYGLQSDGQAAYAIQSIGHLKAFAAHAEDPRPVQQFSVQCLSCHLSAAPISSVFFYRSTGCSSCHLLYDDNGLYQGSDPTIPKNKPGYPAHHEFTTAIPFGQCNHCHNRGNYDLRSMTFLNRADLPAPSNLSVEALRARECYQPIGRFTRCEFELDCLDCHTGQEVMGNGVLYNNRSDAAYIRCNTCHGTLDKLPAEKVIQDTSDLAIRLSQLNPQVDDLKVGMTIMITQRGELLWNIHREGDQWVMIGKVTGVRYTVPLVFGSKCQQKPDQQESHYCHQCHAYAH